MTFANSSGVSSVKNAMATVKPIAIANDKANCGTRDFISLHFASLACCLCGSIRTSRKRGFRQLRFLSASLKQAMEMTGCGKGGKP
jgi:hypothetical protein